VLVLTYPMPIMTGPALAHAVTAAADTLLALLPTLTPPPLAVETASGPGPRAQHWPLLPLLLLVCLAPGPAGPASSNSSLLAENTGAAMLLLLLVEVAKCSAAILLLLILLPTIIFLLLPLPCATESGHRASAVLCCILTLGLLSDRPSRPAVYRSI
jgi:hypothetical protein